MTRPTCKTCRLFEPEPNELTPGYCHRDPRPAQTPPTGWCGSHQLPGSAIDEEPADECTADALRTLRARVWALIDNTEASGVDPVLVVDRADFEALCALVPSDWAWLSDAEKVAPSLCTCDCSEGYEDQMRAASHLAPATDTGPPTCNLREGWGQLRTLLPMALDVASAGVWFRPDPQPAADLIRRAIAATQLFEPGHGNQPLVRCDRCNAVTGSMAENLLCTHSGCLGKPEGGTYRATKSYQP